MGPGSPDCITAKVEKIIRDCDVVIGYQYTLDTIKHLLVDKETVIITMSNQEEAYQRAKETLGNKTLVIPFTGDVNFSESEVIDRLVEIFNQVELHPGISSVQIAAAKTLANLLSYHSSLINKLYKRIPIYFHKLCRFLYRVFYPILCYRILMFFFFSVF